MFLIVTVKKLDPCDSLRDCDRDVSEDPEHLPAFVRSVQQIVFLNPIMFFVGQRLVLFQPAKKNGD